MRIYPFYLKVLDFCYRFLKSRRRKNQVAKKPVPSGRMGIVSILSLLLWSLCSTVVYSESVSEEVQNKLNAITSMSAHFTQVVKAGKREVSKSTGDMALFRPGRFRWQTKSPLSQLVVADGKKLWVYDVDLEQVTVKKQEKGMGGTPALFLSADKDTVSRDFEVKKQEKGSMQSFDLHAKSAKENYQRVILMFNNEELTAIEFFDQLGQHTTVSLSRIKHNLTLADDLFHFTPPKGVDVVRQ